MSLYEKAWNKRIPDELRIFDAHAHFGSDRYSSLFLHSLPVGESVALAKRCGIKRIAGMALGAIGESDAAAENRWMLSQCEKYPELLFYFYYKPMQHEILMTQLEKMKKHPAFFGVKIHPRSDYSSLESKEYDEIIDYAVRNDILILCHTWDTEEMCRPRSFERYLKQYPRFRLLMGHIGGTYHGCLDTLDMAKRYKNVYCDINGSLYSGIWIEELVKMAPEHKFVFSNDETFNDPRIILGRVFFSDLPDRLKEMIFCENIERAVERKLI